MSKGHWQRPLRTGREENELREKLMHGEISRKKFDKEYDKLLRAGKITRDGFVMKPTIKMVTCCVCRGRGIVTEWTKGDYEARASERHPCGNCKGTGEVERCVAKK
jgi:DnaJ-class molecular chaperone